MHLPYFLPGPLGPHRPLAPWHMGTATPQILSGCPTSAEQQPVRHQGLARLGLHPVLDNASWAGSI